ncbi:MAG: ribosome silencing factor [Acidobacteria bacterium]|nr:ribosome silencing factor [Acidobacteriota bacterium]
MQAKVTRKPPVSVEAAAEVAAQVALAPEETADESPNWFLAAQAAQSKQAVDLVALDLQGITTMADTFLVCHGRNNRQNQAIADEIESVLKKEAGERPVNIEGYQTGEWILMDYGDLVVHVFSEKARAYYDLDRLYREAKKLELPADAQPAQ